MNFMKVCKINYLSIGLFFLITAVFICEAAATTYYVSPSGRDTYSGSVDAPFRTIQKAADIVYPGDTVIVRDGTYTDTDGDKRLVLINRAGNSSNPITFKSEHKWGAILDGQNMSGVYGILFGSSAQYIRVENFEIKNTWWSSVSMNNEAITNIVIKGNRIHHIGRTRCTDDTNGITGIGTRAANIIIDSNVIHDIGRLGDGEDGCNPSTTYWKGNDHGIYVHKGNVSITNNVFYNFKHGWAIQIYDSKGSTLSNIDIINNTFADPNPWKTGHIVLYNSLSDVSIYNNIFYKPTSAALRVNNTKTFTNVRVYNNLTTKSSMADNNDTLIFSNNKVNTDPLFENANVRNYYLLEGSLAIDKGIPTGINYDADGNQRDANLDIGAYEYTGSIQAPLPTCDLAQSFEETTLSDGIEYYTDRAYTLTSLPSEYIGLPVIKTPNDDQSLTDSSGYTQFELTDAYKVYVAYDCRGTSLPDWMNGFTDTGDTISTSLSTQPCLRVYEKIYAAGSCVDFGANKASGTSSTSYSNYIVFYGQTAYADAVSPAQPFGLRTIVVN